MQEQENIQTEKSEEKKRYKLTITEQWWDGISESSLHKKIRAIEDAGIVYWIAERSK